LAVAGVVDALEEGHEGGVGRGGGSQVADVLYCDVAVADDVAVVVEVLGCGVVVCCGVDEEAGAEVLGLDGDVEGGVGGELVAGLGVCDDG